MFFTGSQTRQSSNTNQLNTNQTTALKHKPQTQTSNTPPPFPLFAMASSSSSSSSTLLLALCLVLLACVASAAATKPVPAACLRAATSLCRGAQTDALRCLVTKARDGDAQVPQECSDALKELYPRRAQQQQEDQTDRRSRLGQFARLLTEGGCFTTIPQCTGTCPTGTTCPGCYCGGYVSAERCRVLVCVCIMLHLNSLTVRWHPPPPPQELPRPNVSRLLPMLCRPDHLLTSSLPIDKASPPLCPLPDWRRRLDSDVEGLHRMINNCF